MTFLTENRNHLPNMPQWFVHAYLSFYNSLVFLSESSATRNLPNIPTDDWNKTVARNLLWLVTSSLFEKQTERGRMQSPRQRVTIESKPVNLASTNEQTESCQPAAHTPRGYRGQNSSKIQPTVRQLALTWRSPAFWITFNSGPRSDRNTCFNDRSRTRVNCVYFWSIGVGRFLLTYVTNAGKLLIFWFIICYREDFTIFN